MTETAALQWMLSKIETIKAALNIEEKIFFDKAPKNTGSPCLVCQVIGGDQTEVTDSGPVESGTLDVQLRYYARTRPAATAARDLLRVTLQNVERTSTDEITIAGTGFANGGDTFEDKTEDYGSLSIVAIHWENLTTAASE